MKLTKEQRIFIVVNFLDSNSIQHVQELFQERFPERNSPSKVTICLHCPTSVCTDTRVALHLNRRKMIAATRDAVSTERVKLHCDGKYMNTTLAEFKVKKARFDERATLPILGFVPIKKPILTASYEVACLIAKQGKPHTIGETLVKPAVLKMANIMLVKEAEVKLSQITLSNDTISDRIEDTSRDILAQAVADLISSPAKFSLQLDETTDVFNLSQLAVFVRYVKDDVIKIFYFVSLSQQLRQPM
ncbi:Protein of unknown function DUF4817 [Trinorchestia longiramus]|nr:Protein of unknown function DUF4817 [Trinorchestia longiramus]